MESKNRGLVLFGALAAVLALTPLGGRAQDAPPGGGPPGRFGGPGGGRGGFRGDQPVTLATAPVEALASALKLTAEQKQRISEIQGGVRGGRRGQGGGAGGPGGSPGDFQAQRQQRQQQAQAASTQIEALLTAEQKQALPSALRDIQTLRQAGLPAELLGTLGLTAEQKTRLADIGAKAQQAMQRQFEAAQQGGAGPDRQAMQQARAQTEQQVLAVLTAAQKAQVEKYRSENPQRGGRGGRGGFRGGPGGGPGGPGGPAGGV